MRRPACALAALSCLYAGATHAQVSGSIALVSDYLYRGVSLSDGKPVPQLHVALDGEAGWYAGLFASRLGAYGGGRAQSIAYAGYARRLAAGWSWDAGLSQYSFLRDGASNYREAQIGVSAGSYSVRLSYAPDYMGVHARSVYLQASASHALSDNLSAFAHAGYLDYLKGGPPYMARNRLDGRIGVVLALDDWKLQLAWDALHVAQAEGPSYGAYVRSREGLFASATRSF